MISSETIRKFAVENQTTEINILREYLQNLFLSYLYQEHGSENILFKGGTALRLIWQSPRYSEDLDFTGFAIREKSIENIIKRTLIGVNRENVDMKITESKSTSGGYLSIIEGVVGVWESRILIEVSLRPKKQVEKDAILITNPFIPSYIVFSLPENQIVQEKINALLKRKNPRDFFDLYFILRKRLSIKIIASHKNKLMDETKKIDNKAISRELKIFLPQSFWPVLNKFRENLIKELERI